MSIHANSQICHSSLKIRHRRTDPEFPVAIRRCDEQLLPSSNTPTAQRWRRIAAEHNGSIPPEFLIPDCVDEAVPCS